MSDFALAGLDEIQEIEGRCPFGPLRHHFGITSFAAALRRRTRGPGLRAQRLGAVRAVIPAVRVRRI
jgi:hypothetical protein